jgi:hypothetical protein
MEQHPIRVAMEARDQAAVVAQLSPDVVLYSPILGRGRFEGRAAVSLLFSVLLEEYEDWHCLAELRGPGHHVLVTQTRVHGAHIELVDVLRHDSEGQVCEVRVMARPLSGVGTLTAVLGPALAQRRSRWRGAVMRAVTAPLPPLLRAGEWLGGRLSMPQEAR